MYNASYSAWHIVGIWKHSCSFLFLIPDAKHRERHVNAAHYLWRYDLHVTHQHEKNIGPALVRLP